MSDSLCADTRRVVVDKVREFAQSEEVSGSSESALLASGRSWQRSDVPGQVFWITGLSGAGKTTVARRLWVRLRELDRAAVFLTETRSGRSSLKSSGIRETIAVVWRCAMPASAESCPCRAWMWFAQPYRYFTMYIGGAGPTFPDITRFIYAFPCRSSCAETQSISTSARDAAR